MGLIFEVTNDEGIPLVGILATLKSQCSPLGGQTSTGTTDSEGKVVLETGCALGGKYSVNFVDPSAQYAETTYEGNIGAFSGKSIPIAMQQEVSPTTGAQGQTTCPQGYYYDPETGKCIQAPSKSYTGILQNIANGVKSFFTGIGTIALVVVTLVLILLVVIGIKRGDDKE